MDLLKRANIYNKLAGDIIEFPSALPDYLPEDIGFFLENFPEYLPSIRKLSDEDKIKEMLTLAEGVTDIRWYGDMPLSTTNRLKAWGVKDYLLPEDEEALAQWFTKEVKSFPEWAAFAPHLFPETDPKTLFFTPIVVQSFSSDDLKEIALEGENPSYPEGSVARLGALIEDRQEEMKPILKDVWEDLSQAKKNLVKEVYEPDELKEITSSENIIVGPWK